MEEITQRRESHASGALPNALVNTWALNRGRGTGLSRLRALRRLGLPGRLLGPLRGGRATPMISRDRLAWAI